MYIYISYMPCSIETFQYSEAHKCQYQGQHFTLCLVCIPGSPPHLEHMYRNANVLSLSWSHSELNVLNRWV